MAFNSPFRRLAIAGLLLLAAAVAAEDPPPLDAATLSALGIEQEASLPDVRPNDGSWDWASGPYRYDGAGNITSIGTQSFAYDVRGRLVSATMTRSDQPGSQQFTYAYDVMGNMISRTAVTSTPIPTPASLATNRLTSNGAAYDAAGNVTVIQPPGQPYTYLHEYDALNALQKTSVTASPNTPRYHIYTADDERLWTFDGATGVSRWTLRDLSGKVLRDFTFDWAGTTPRWRLSRDYVYRDGLLLAAITPTETLHFSLDHLGSPRVVTDDARVRVGLHYYLPFGEEWLTTPQASDTEPMKFTGHERDSDVAGGTASLDYMHARYYGSRMGRFSSVDPIVDIKRALRNPQMWSRYSYVTNNPLNRIDPDGRLVQLVGSEEERKKAFEILRSTLRENDRKYLTMDGKGVISVDAKATGGVAMLMLRDLARQDVPMVTVQVGTTVTMKVAPGPSRFKTQDLQTGGGGATVPPLISKSGNMEVHVDPRGSLRFGSPALAVMAHELMGHAWSLLFNKGDGSERSAVNTENNILLQLGLQPYQP